MAERSAPPAPISPSGKAVLRIEDLQVYYGESHALQGVSLTLDSGVLSVVGRNGMGKTTLCNTIAGLKRARFPHSNRTRSIASASAMCRRGVASGPA
jgi:ABC-type branched-subunit amino acid transport system ATPase component